MQLYTYVSIHTFICLSSHRFRVFVVCANIYSFVCIDDLLYQDHVGQRKKGLYNMFNQLVSYYKNSMQPCKKLYCRNNEAVASFQ